MGSPQHPLNPSPRPAQPDSLLGQAATSPRDFAIAGTVMAILIGLLTALTLH
jgi:hypothetical protein